MERKEGRRENTKRASGKESFKLKEALGKFPHSAKRSAVTQRISQTERGFVKKLAPSNSFLSVDNSHTEREQCIGARRRNYLQKRGEKCVNCSWPQKWIENENHWSFSSSVSEKAFKYGFP